MNITVTHTIHPEVMNLLASVFAGTAKPSTPGITASSEVVSKKKTASENGDGAANQKNGAEVITVEAVRAAVQAKNSGDKATKQKIKALLTEFGTDSVTNLDKDNYSAFLEKLKAI